MGALTESICAPATPVRRLQPMIQLTRTGLHCDADIETLRAEFARTHAIRLPGLFGADLMHMFFREMEAGNWITNQDGDIAREVLLKDIRAPAVADFVANTPELLSAVRQITGCEAIIRFHGRIYRMIPGTDHYDSWHDDCGDGRLVGMSVNLGPRPYLGGVFQFRSPGTDQVLGELPNTGQGDAILFRISEDLQHRVTPMEGAEPKTAFAGWFESGSTDYYTALRRASVRT
jgi:hypothetical protein